MRQTRWNIFEIQRGFTLIEIMLAVFVLALLSGIVIVNLASEVRAASVEARLARIRAIDHAARESARTLGRQTGLEFDLSALGIKEIRTSETSAMGGTFSMDCSMMGITQSYAVHVVSPQVDKWVVVAGATGEMFSVKDEAEAQSILREASGHAD